MLKRIIVFLLILAVALALGLTALAEGPGSGDGSASDDAVIDMSAASDGGQYETRASGVSPVHIAIVILLPCVIAGIVVGIFYSQMKTAHIKHEAEDYIGHNGLRLSMKSDQFTGKTYDRIYEPRQQQQPGGPGGRPNGPGR